MYIYIYIWMFTDNFIVIIVMDIYDYYPMIIEDPSDTYGMLGEVGTTPISSSSSFSSFPAIN